MGSRKRRRRRVSDSRMNLSLTPRSQSALLGASIGMDLQPPRKGYPSSGLAATSPGMDQRNREAARAITDDIGQRSAATPGAGAGTGAGAGGFTTYPDESRRAPMRDQEGNRGRGVVGDGRPQPVSRGDRLLAQQQADQQAALDAQQEQLARLRRQQRRAAAAQRTATRVAAQQRRNSVFVDMASRFGEYGLNGQEIMAALKGMPSGWENSTAKMVEVVRGTSTWRDEFGAVFDARKSGGFAPLNEGDIVTLRSEMKSTLNDYVPEKFWNSDKDFDKFIAGDISVDEVTERAKTAYEFVKGRDPNQLKAFKDFYGIGRKELTAYYLDPDKALPKLQERAEMGRLGGKMLDADLHVKNAKGFARELFGKGVDEQTAERAFQDTAEVRDDYSRLGSLDGEKFTDRQLAEASLGTDATQRKRKKATASSERARWGGGAGGSATFTGSTSGSF